MGSSSACRASAFALTFLAATFVAGCPSGVGGTRCTDPDGPDGGMPPSCQAVSEAICDELADELARTPVYDASGEPLYAGQALMLEHCALCHFTPRPGGTASRFGAPVGLDFDVARVSATGSAGVEEARRLQHAQASIHRHRDLVHQQVVGGAMPPRGYVRTGPSSYAFADGTPLPGIRDPEAHRILRHWLSCGSPVVERTSSDGLEACTDDSMCLVTHHCDLVDMRCVGVGDVVPPRPVALEPRWSAVYGFLRPSCATVGCHDDASAASGLAMGSSEGAYRALVGVGPGAASLSCRDETMRYVEPGDPDRSLLVSKVESAMPACGARMPIVGTALSAEQIAALREWIALGARND